MNFGPVLTALFFAGWVTAVVGGAWLLVKHRLSLTRTMTRSQRREVFARMFVLQEYRRPLTLFTMGGSVAIVALAAFAFYQHGGAHIGL